MLKQILASEQIIYLFCNRSYICMQICENILSEYKQVMQKMVRANMERIRFLFPLMRFEANKKKVVNMAHLGKGGRDCHNSAYSQLARQVLPHYRLDARDGILERHFKSRFLGINSSPLRLEVGLVFYPLFPFTMLFMNRLKFSCFADFFVRILKPEKNTVFF
jgi:hypothetical protein